MEEKNILGCKNVLELREMLAKFSPSIEETFFVFDIDRTLVKTKEPASSNSAIYTYMDFLKSLESKLSKEQTEEMYNLSVGNSEIQFMDEETLPFVNDLKQKNANMIVLTATLSGKVQEQERFEVFRVKAFNELGLNLQTNLFGENDFVLEEFAPFRGNRPVFYNGFAFSNGIRSKNHKGDVLLGLLDRMSFKPKKIVFVDDRLQNCKDVMKSLTEHKPDIDVLSVEYEQDKYETSIVDIDEYYFKNYWLNLAKKIEDISL